MPRPSLSGPRPLTHHAYDLQAMVGVISHATVRSARKPANGQRRAVSLLDCGRSA